MAAEASDPEMSGIDAAKNHEVWRAVAEPWPRSRVHASGIRAPTPPVRSIDGYHAKHSLLSRRMPQHTPPRRPPTRAANPQFGMKSADPVYPHLKVRKPEELPTCSNVRRTARCWALRPR
jgi:hypothetical protein